MLLDTISVVVNVISIIVTVIGIVVTTISIRHDAKDTQNKRSNRRDQT